MTAVSYTHTANIRSHRLCKSMGAVVDPDARAPCHPNAFTATTLLRTPR